MGWKKGFFFLSWNKEDEGKKDYVLLIMFVVVFFFLRRMILLLEGRVNFKGAGDDIRYR